LTRHISFDHNIYIELLFLEIKKIFSKSKKPKNFNEKLRQIKNYKFWFKAVPMVFAVARRLLTGHSSVTNDYNNNDGPEDNFPPTSSSPILGGEDDDGLTVFCLFFFVFRFPQTYLLLQKIK
jgi:hypothetical protein